MLKINSDFDIDLCALPTKLTRQNEILFIFFQIESSLVFSVFYVIM
jgi:hypothetical protein